MSSTVGAASTLYAEELNSHLREQYTKIRKILRNSSKPLNDSDFKALQNEFENINLRNDAEYYNFMHTLIRMDRNQVDKILNYDPNSRRIDLVRNYCSFLELSGSWHLCFFMSPEIIDNVLKLYSYGVHTVFTKSTTSFRVLRNEPTNVNSARPRYVNKKNSETPSNTNVVKESVDDEGFTLVKRNKNKNNTQEHTSSDDNPNVWNPEEVEALKKVSWNEEPVFDKSKVTKTTKEAKVSESP